MRGLLAALVLLALATTALAAPVTGTETVAAGRFAERNLPLAQGARVAWTLAVAPEGARASWDIHSHPGNRVETHEGGVLQGARSGTFVAPRADTFSWLVVNNLTTAPVQVTITTEELGAAPPSNPTPGPPVLLALAGAALLLARRRGA
jgi:hypothetical protein